MMYGEVGFVTAPKLSKGIITRELLRDVALKEAAEVLVVIKSRKTGPSGFRLLFLCFGRPAIVLQIRANVYCRRTAVYF